MAEFKGRNVYIPFEPAKLSLKERLARKLASIFNRRAEHDAPPPKARKTGMTVTPRFAGIVLSLAAVAALSTDLKPLETLKNALKGKTASAQALTKTDLESALPVDNRTIIDKQNTTPNFLVENLYRASIKSNFNFMYLYHLSKLESSHLPYASANTSSALGLFQFTNDTWIKTFVAHAADYGYGDYARQIRRNSDGDYVFPNNAMRDYVTVTLRQNPEFSGEMAAELAKDNYQYLQENYAGKITLTEVLVAHFFGGDSAVKFLNAKDSTPDLAAASLFPKQAEKNEGTFYSKSSDNKLRARSVLEIYQLMAHKMPSFPVFEKDQVRHISMLERSLPKM